MGRWMRRFRRRGRRGGQGMGGGAAEATPDPRDQQAIDAMKAAGEDLSATRTIEHRLLFPTAEAAQSVAERATDRGFPAQTRPAENGQGTEVVVRQSAMVTIDNVTQARFRLTRHGHQPRRVRTRGGRRRKPDRQVTRPACGAALRHLVGDDHPLDLGGALPDPIDAQLAVEPFGDVLPHESAPAEDLHGAVGDAVGGLATRTASPSSTGRAGPSGRRPRRCSWRTRTSSAATPTGR